VPGVEIDDIESTAKTLPQFAALWTGQQFRGVRATPSRELPAL
jgi:hypothetical protein